MHIFVCNSPLQILNSIEARHKFNIPDNESVLVLVPLANNIRSLEEAASMVGWRKIITLPVRPVKRYSGVGELWRRLQNRHRYVLDWKRRLNPYKKYSPVAYFSRTSVEPVEQIVNWLKPKSLIHIDDGTLSARLVYEKQKRADSMSDDKEGGDGCGFRKSKGVKASVWRLQDRILGVSSLPSDPDVFFSVYIHEPNANFVLNEGSWLAAQVDRASISRGQVHFLGAPFVERRLVDRDRYCSFLRVVKREFGDCSFLYILHPAESDEMGEYISHCCGFEVVRWRLPYEVEFARMGLKPEIVASWFCTALESLSRVTQGQGVSFFAFDIGRLGAGNSGVAQAGRDFFERNAENPNIKIARIGGDRI